MKDSFNRFGGASAIIVGALSLLYAVFYLILSNGDASAGRLGSWIILSVSGIFTSAAYVALYQRLRASSEGYALWGLLLGLAQSAATFAGSAYQALLIVGLQRGEFTQAAFDAARAIPTQSDPKGAATFFIFAITSFVFGWLIVNGNALPKLLGYVAFVNSFLLVVLFLANVFGSMPLILGAGGLSSLIATPVWWVWLGLQLRKEMM